MKINVLSSQKGMKKHQIKNIVPNSLKNDKNFKYFIRQRKQQNF